MIARARHRPIGSLRFENSDQIGLAGPLEGLPRSVVFGATL